MTLQATLPAPAQSRCGESFKNGKLYHFDGKRILVVKPWPEMRAWYKTSKLPWRHTRRFADECIMNELFSRVVPPVTEEQKRSSENLEKLSREYCETMGVQYNLERDKDYSWQEKLYENRHLVLTQFFDTIPDPERDFVLRFHDRRWHLLALFARCPGAFDLAQSNPALAYALASNWALHQPAVSQPMRAARSLVKKKQREILTWLGFPGTEQTRKILAKIPPEEISLEGIMNMRRILTYPIFLKLLSHAKIISNSMLIFMNNSGFRPWLSPLFLEEISSYRSHRKQGSESFWEAYKYLHDLLRMQEQTRVALRPLQSIAQLKALHDETIEVYNTMNTSVSLLPFPPPPYAGKKGLIEPITCDQSLKDEGLEMMHCVGSYTSAVQRGEVYVYRVLSPVRATLSICRHNHNWKPAEISGTSNRKIPIGVANKLFADLTGE